MSNFGIGTMNQLGDALKEAGFKKENDITQLRSNKRLLAQLHEVTKGAAKICYVLSGNDDSGVPDGFKLEQEFTNNFIWDPKRFIAYVSIEQESGQLVSIAFLSSLVAAKEAPMNAAVADLLIHHQWLIDEIIPEESGIERILFLATIYTDCCRNRFVSCLEYNPNYWSDADASKWQFAYKSINEVCDKNTVVALLD